MSWVYMQYPDDMGHRFGDSPEYLAAVQDMDRRVGKIWEAVKHAVIPLSEDLSGFYKIVLERKHNTVNRWFKQK